jgi:hypothetical protein
MKFTASVSTLVAALTLASLGAAPASAAMPSAVPNIQSAGSAGDAATLQKVQWRPGYYRGWDGPWRGRPYWRWRDRGVGPAIGAGIAGLIIGGAIAASQRDYRDRWEQCDEQYRSFRWSDGTFQPYGGGPRELCPYLRG